MPGPTLLDLLPGAKSTQTPTAIIIPASDHAEELDVNYQDLRAFVLGFRQVLRAQLGVNKGDVVAMSFPNSLEFVVGFLATGAARAISAPLNPAYTVDEFRFYLGDTKPIVLLVPAGGDRKQYTNALEAAKKENVHTAEFSIAHGKIQLRTVFTGKRKPPTSGSATADEPQPSDTALVLHTSGTTGRPKSVPLSHANLIRTTENIGQTYDLRESDRTYLVMPLFHVHGLLAGLLAPLRAEGSVVIPPKFAATRFWKDFKETRCNWYTAVPTIHNILLNTTIPSPLPKIKFIRSCSSALPPVIFHRLEETFKAPVLEAYAMTEAAHQMTSNISSSRLPGSVGLGIGVDISIRHMDTGDELAQGEIGEVCVRGTNVTKGYWENDKANKESFWSASSSKSLTKSTNGFDSLPWFRSGDQGLILPSGQLKLTGRIKELINRGGEKLAPLEIDAALLGVEGVGEAVCFGVEDEKYGEVVWAGVVLKQGYKAKDGKTEQDRIRKALQGKIANFKIPDRIIVTDAIPKTATGKIQRRFVREAFVKLAKEQEGGAKAKL